MRRPLRHHARRGGGAGRPREIFTSGRHAAFASHASQQRFASARTRAM